MFQVGSLANGNRRPSPTQIMSPGPELPHFCDAAVPVMVRGRATRWASMRIVSPLMDICQLSIRLEAEALCHQIICL